MRAKARLDRLELYPRPVSLRGVRIWIAPRLFRLPWFRRFDGYAAHWTILLRARELLDDEELVAHELCHVWQMQHRPLRMPLSYVLPRLRGQPYELEAREAARGLLHSTPWRRRPHSRPASSCRSSSGCRGSARSTRSRSRSARPSSRSAAIKKDAKLWALELAIRCCDLTTLEGQDTPGKVAALCSKAIRPDPTDPSVPSVAAVCVYPNLVPAARERLAGQRRQGRVRSRPAFPSGQSPLDVKVARGRRTPSRSAPTRSTW